MKPRNSLLRSLQASPIKYFFLMFICIVLSTVLVYSINTVYFINSEIKKIFSTNIRFFENEINIEQVANLSSKETQSEEILYPIILNKRKIGVGDLNGDGLDDLVLAPTLFDQKPELNVEVWLNKGNGVFENVSKHIFKDLIPRTGSVNGIFIKDFNKDKINDLFWVDQGLEGQFGFKGGQNKLFFGTKEGYLIDSSENFPENHLAFNHPSSVGEDELNLDILITSLGGDHITHSGVLLLKSEINGKFQNKSNELPAEIRYMKSSDRALKTQDAQYAGASLVVDIDNDNNPELLTASYGNADQGTKNQRSVRVYKKSSSFQSEEYLEVGRMLLPLPLLDIWYFEKRSDYFFGMGAADIDAVDLNSDGLKDIIVLWETKDESFITVYRNLGNFKFIDVTLEYFKSYRTTQKSKNTFNYFVATHDFIDIDSDGYVDIFLNRGALPQDLLKSEGLFYKGQKEGAMKPVPIALNSDWKLQDPNRDSTFFCKTCSYHVIPMHLNTDRKTDLLLMAREEKASNMRSKSGFVYFWSLYAK